MFIDWSVFLLRFLQSWLYWELCYSSLWLMFLLEWSMSVGIFVYDFRIFELDYLRFNEEQRSDGFRFCVSKLPRIFIPSTGFSERCDGRLSSEEVVCERSTEQLYHWITGFSPGARFIWSHARSYYFWFHARSCWNRLLIGVELADWRNKFSS